MTDLPERLNERAAKLRAGTNDQHTPALLEEAAKTVEALEAKVLELKATTREFKFERHENRCG